MIDSLEVFLEGASEVKAPSVKPTDYRYAIYKKYILVFDIVKMNFDNYNGVERLDLSSIEVRRSQDWIGKLLR
jgi:hypothetical protein